MQIPDSIFSNYGLSKNESEIIPFGTGLINHTWKIVSGGKSFILQKINTKVFKVPVLIATNIQAVADYLEVYYPEYLFIAPLNTLKQEQMVYAEEYDGGFYRLFPFMEGSHTIDVVTTPQQAFEAASQFGRFTRLLAGFEVHNLQITLPYFHDLSFRYLQFTEALQTGNKERILASSALIEFIKEHRYIVDRYASILANPSFALRVTHHDTKISNVLFGTDEKALCVIDLDTIMPGYIISDIGDMMRTYLPTVSEEETDFTKIEVRDEVYRAIVQGYSNEMGDILSDEEKKSFFYAGLFMIYMQALRFLTDHLNEDTYYGARYPDHNFVRAGNQIVLLQKLMNKRSILEE